MCDFCKEHDDLFEKPIIRNITDLGELGDLLLQVYLEGENGIMGLDAIGIHGKFHIEKQVKIKYCPMCGQKL